jgi:hypothetical protein
MFWSYVFVLLIGCFVGVIEIASRHTDYRFAAVRSGPGMIYVVINGIVSILALALIEYMMPSWLGYHADKPAGDHGDSLLCVLTAGLGAGTFLRSSLFKLQAGAFPGSPFMSTCMCAFAPYDIPNARAIGYDVVCNRPKVAAYRAPGAPISSFAVECAVDDLARMLGMDPLVLRDKNAAGNGTVNLCSSCRPSQPCGVAAVGT